MRFLVGFITFLWAFYAQASFEQYPEEFSSFFEMTEKKVNIRGIDGSVFDIVLGVNYHKVQLINDDKSINNLRAFFTKNNIKENVIEEILHEFVQGIENTKNCKEFFIKDCVLLPEKYEFIYDYDGSALYFFVNPNILLTKNEKSSSEYNSEKDNNASFINHFSASIDKYDGGVKGAIRDETLIGMPYGYVQSDFQYLYSNENDNFDLYKFGYHLDMPGYHFRAGTYLINESFNATDILFFNGGMLSNKEESIAFGSSKNLLEGARNQNRTIHFFAPISGRLIVKRENQILINRNTEGGQQKLSYQDLPFGKYKISLEVRAGDKLLYESQHEIVNRRQDTLAKGESDFYVSAGRLTNTHYSASEQDSSYFMKGLISYRLVDPVLLAFGVTLSNSGDMGQGAVNVNLPFNMDFSASVNLFTTGETYVENTLSYNQFSFVYEKFNKPTTVLNLATNYFGSYGYERAYLNVNHSFTTNTYGSMNLMYQKHLNDYSINEQRNSYQELNLLGSLSIATFANSRVDLNLGYSYNFDEAKQSDRSDVTFSIGFTLPLSFSGSVQASSLASVNKRKDVLFRNGLSHNDLFKTDYMRSSATIGSTYLRRTTGNSLLADASWSTYINRPEFSGGVYGSYDTKGYKGVSANIASSQVWSDNKMKFTSIKANSYGIVNVKSLNGNVESDNTETTGKVSKGFLTIKENKKTKNNLFIYDENTLFPLNVYKAYELDLNTSMSDFKNTGQRVKYDFTHPGSVLSIDAKVDKTSMIIAGFKDVFEQPITALKCIGSGCIRISLITDSVYNLVIKEGAPFLLKTENMNCIVPDVNLKKKNYGMNYCIPNVDVGSFFNIKTKNKKQNVTMQFIGQYSNDVIAQSFIRELEKELLQIYSKQIGEYLYVYVNHKAIQKLTSKQEMLLNNLIEIAKHKETSDAKLFSLIME